MEKYSAGSEDAKLEEATATGSGPAANFLFIVAESLLPEAATFGIKGHLEMESQRPPERFPAIGTVEDPALFRDCDRNLLLSYEIAPDDGGGVAILAFNDVVYYEQNPNNVHEGLLNSKYPARPWDFTEILGSDRTARWSSEHFQRRFWTISFNDWMIEVVFGGVKLVHVSAEQIAPDAGLSNYLAVPR